jgi:hypothetical protein
MNGCMPDEVNLGLVRGTDMIQSQKKGNSMLNTIVAILKGSKLLSYNKSLNVDPFISRLYCALRCASFYTIQKPYKSAS